MAERGARFLLVTLLGLLAVGFLLVRPILGAVAFAAILAHALHPLHRRLARLVRFPAVSASLLVLGVLAGLVLPFVLVGVAVVDQALEVAARARAAGGPAAAAVAALVGAGVEEAAARAAVEGALRQGAALLEGAALPALTAVVHLATGLLVFAVLLWFLLRDGERLVGFLRESLPLEPERRERLLHGLGRRSRDILLGTLVVGLAQGVAAGVGWWLLGFPQPLFWGFVMTLLAILPFAAPFLVMVPAGVLAILQGRLLEGVALVAWALVLVGLVDDLVRPWLVGRRSGVHPALVLVGIAGGVPLLGPSGLLLGPILLGLLVPVWEAWAAASRGEPERGPRQTI